MKPIQAFTAVKHALADAALLSHLKPDALTGIMTNASDVAMGAVLQQRIGNEWRPISYFSKKLRPAETRYSVFDRELLAVYLAIKHFHHFVEGCTVHMLTDHKPLMYALSSQSDRYTPRRLRHLDLISQFTTDIRHVSRTLISDALSRVGVNALHYTESPAFDFRDIAAA